MTRKAAHNIVLAKAGANTLVNQISSLPAFANTFPLYAMLHLSSKIKTLSISAFMVVLCSSLEPEVASKSLTTLKTDTLPQFKKEIPTYEDGNLDIFYTIKKQKERQLNLDSLESGFDSLQIRIWYDYALLINRELVVITRKSDQWFAEHYLMTVEWNSQDITEKIATNQKKSLIPKNGWENFMKELFSLKVMTLPSIDSIPRLVDTWTDGVTYNFEIATKSQYRFYSYHLPDKFQDRFWEARNVVKILDLIETDLK